MAKTIVSNTTQTPDAYADIPAEHDGRPFHTPPEGWQPENRPPIPALQGASQDDYDAAIRKQLLPRESFWRRYVHHAGFRKFIKDKSEAERALTCRWSVCFSLGH